MCVGVGVGGDVVVVVVAVFVVVVVDDVVVVGMVGTVGVDVAVAGRVASVVVYAGGAVGIAVLRPLLWMVAAPLVLSVWQGDLGVAPGLSCGLQGWCCLCCLHCGRGWSCRCCWCL